jgi:MoxR-like ATPase
MAGLQAQLNAVGYRITAELSAQVEAALATKPCGGAFLTGPAGSGKTFLAEALGQVQGRETFFFQAFPGCRKEELYQTILPDAAQPSGFRTQKGVLPLAAEHSQRGRTALVLDEWDKTHPSTDAFLLDFLQNGRVSIPGSEVRARQEHLVVFVTLNDERELSEPLLRRLPLLELKPPPSYLVAQALSDTHGDHRYLPAAVTLYRRSLLVNLTKPVTIQELRQLLDAIDLLGEQADWNRLVFQFVSKSWDDHELLKSAEALPLAAVDFQSGGERPVLTVEHYGPSDLEPGQPGAHPALPRVERDWLARIPTREVQADPERVYGVVRLGEPGYDAVARALLSRPGATATESDPADLRIAQVGDAEIIVFEALNFVRPEEWALILQNGGELLLEARHGGEVTAAMLLDFKAAMQSAGPEDPDRCRIYSLTAGEMLMRYRSLKLRWTPTVLEIVTNEYAQTRELWDFLYSPRGAIMAARVAEQRVAEGEPRGGLPDNEQLRQDYLFVLRDYRHLREWFGILIGRNLHVWGRVTCDYRNLTVLGSILPATEFKPDQEHPESKEEAESIQVYRRFTQPALDYYSGHVGQLESELTHFVARNGEFPPAVEDGGIFGLHEVQTDLGKIKREGLRLFMRKTVREA